MSTNIIKTQKEVVIGDKTIVVKKLPLRRITVLLQAVGKLPEEITGITDMQPDEVVANMATMLAVALPKIADVLVEAIDKQITADFLLDEAGFDEALELVTVILEVNNVAGIIDRLKKLQALAPKVK